MYLKYTLLPGVQLPKSLRVCSVHTVHCTYVGTCVLLEAINESHVYALLLAPIFREGGRVGTAEFFLCRL